MKSKKEFAEIAFKMTSASNQDLLQIIRNNRPNTIEYEIILDMVDEPTADRISYAMALHRCEFSGDKEYKFAPGEPKAWQEHA